MGLPGCLFVCHLILLLVCFLFNCIYKKGSRSISITHSEWNDLIHYIPKILENLDPCKDSKFPLSNENLYVTTIKHQAHKYVGFHRGTSGDGSGVTMDMDEWGDFLECVAESVIEELNESHANFYDLEIRDLIWEDLVHQYYTEAVAAFSRPLFAEVCR